MKLQVVTNGGIGYYFPIPFDRDEKRSKVEIFTCFMEPWINSHYFYHFWSWNVGRTQQGTKRPYLTNYQSSKMGMQMRAALFRV